MSPLLLDTNILSYYLHRDARARYPVLVDKVDGLIPEQGLCLSVVTAYEIKRGLNLLAARGEGHGKRSRFLLLLQAASVFGLDAFSARGWEVAADLYARGKLATPAVNFSEGDLLVAATAMTHRRTLVTADTTLGQQLASLGTAVEVWPPG